MRCSSPRGCSQSRIVEKCAMPSESTSVPGPSPTMARFGHHWCADSCAVIQNAAFASGLLCDRKPMFSEKEMFPGGACAYVGRPANSDKRSVFHGNGANH